LCSKGYSKRVAFHYLEELSNQFNRKVSEELQRNSIAFSLQMHFFKDIEMKQGYYNNPDCCKCLHQLESNKHFDLLLEKKIKNLLKPDEI